MKHLRAGADSEKGSGLRASLKASERSLKRVLTRLLKDHPEQVRPENIKLAVYIMVHAVMGVLQTAVMDSSESYSEGELRGELGEMVKGYILKRRVDSYR